MAPVPGSGFGSRRTTNPIALFVNARLCVVTGVLPNGHLLVAGEKQRRRMLAEGLIRQGAHAVVGYPKFEAIDRMRHAATRSLLNTAKVMEGNPVALRMKELETLERVAERIDKISVFGGLDQVLNGLVKLR